MSAWEMDGSSSSSRQGSSKRLTHKRSRERDVSKHWLSSAHTMFSDTDDSDSGNGHTGRTWLDEFLERPGCDWFCRIPPAFAEDRSNVFGIKLPEVAPGKRGEDDSTDDSFDSDSTGVDEGEALFGQVHARYLFTSEGTAAMAAKWRDGKFGYCPRRACDLFHLLPIGQSDRPGEASVKTWCMNCCQMYHADAMHEHLDGAHFTTSFAHYFALEIAARSERGALLRPAEPGSVT